MKTKYYFISAILNSMIVIILFSWKNILSKEDANLLLSVVWFFSLVAFLNFTLFIGASLKFLNKNNNET